MNRAMMGTLGVLLIGALTTPCGAALLFLTNAETGQDQLNLASGESGDINMMLTIRAMDTGFAFANIFLNDDDNQADGLAAVTALTEGIGTIYDRTAFTFPADISHDINNEYGLIMGSGPDSGQNWGPGTYVLDTLTITQIQSGGARVPVTFEKGARAPSIFTASFLSMPWGVGLDNIAPNFADPGVGGEDHPFILNLGIPEPSAIVLMALSSLALLRRPGGVSKHL